MRDPYDVLGVAKKADIKAVKAAYRKLARKLHPDLHPGDAKAEERFKEVAAAYDFLSDSDKKARYDRGEIDAAGMPRAERAFYHTYAEGAPGGRYHDPRETLRDVEGFEFFTDLFGGFGRDRRGPGGVRGADVRYTLDVDFVDAITGVTREVVLADGKRLKVTIPPGSADGQVLRLKGQGQAGAGAGTAGDARIELRVRSHSVLSRQGQDIHAEIPVTLPEAVLGAKIEVPTVDGRVTLNVPAGSNTGSRLRLKGKGVPGRGGTRGDQYVTLKVVLPERPDPDLERLVREYDAKRPYSARRGS